MSLVERIAEICSNQGYATIIAAIIAAILPFFLYNRQKYRKRGRKDSPPPKPEPVVVPPPVDPLSTLKGDPLGVKDIDNLGFGSPGYKTALEVRMNLLKNSESKVDVY